MDDAIYLIVAAVTFGVVLVAVLALERV